MAQSSSNRPPSVSYTQMPQDARLIALIIASMGIQDIEPGVEMMLLEWAHRYIHTVLSDAMLYSAHAHPSSSSNPQIDLADVILAIQSNLTHSMVQQPSKSTLLSLASSLNSTPLPPISDRYGLRLPPREHCLTNVNFNIVPEPLDDDDDDEEHEDAAGKAKEVVPSSGQTNEVGEEDVESPAADASMEDVDQVPAEKRGVKRNLDEDEDYD